LNNMLEYGKQILKEQPFSLLLGTELTILEEGNAELTLIVRSDFQQNHGFVHGGVVSYLADNCITYAGASVLGNCVTSEYKVNYVRPAIGKKLIARATVLSSGKRQATCDCKVFALGDEGETLVAVALGTINKVES
jgi:uncharacterized protein (TIGR00369 family)